MGTLAEVVVVGLVAYRLWRLEALDSITEPLRARISSDFIHEFIACPWCSGFWWSLGVAFALSSWLTSPWLLVGVAASVVVGFLGERG